jgi:hypothetical protein
MRKIAGKIFHEAAFLFPRMTDDERQEATASIAQLGVLEPIVYVTRPDGQRRYIDGVNRAEIAHELRTDCPEEEYRVDTARVVPGCPLTWKYSTTSWRGTKSDGTSQAASVPPLQSWPVPCRSVTGPRPRRGCVLLSTRRGWHQRR